MGLWFVFLLSLTTSITEWFPYRSAMQSSPINIAELGEMFVWTIFNCLMSLKVICLRASMAPALQDFPSANIYLYILYITGK